MKRSEINETENKSFATYQEVRLSVSDLVLLLFAIGCERVIEAGKGFEMGTGFS